MTRFKQCLMMLIMFLSACKKQVKPGKDEPNPVVQEPGVKKFLPVVLASGKLKLTLSYIENTSRLETITASDGYSATVIYKKNLPYRLDHFKRGVRFYFEDYVYNGQALSFVTRFKEEGILNTHEGNFEPKYDASGQIQNIDFYDISSLLVSTTVFSYNPAGNLITVETTGKTGIKNTLTLTYDSKNGIFRSVDFADLLFLEFDYDVLCAGQNNRTSLENKAQPAENLSLAYQYNTDDYPSEVSITKNKVKQTFKITYKELKQ